MVVATATLPRNDTLQLPRHLGNLCHCGTLSPLFSFPTNLCYLCSFIQAVLSSWTTDTTSVADTFSAPRTSVRISLELLPDDGNRRNPWEGAQEKMTDWWTFGSLDISDSLWQRLDFKGVLELSLQPFSSVVIWYWIWKSSAFLVSNSNSCICDFLSSEGIWMSQVQLCGRSAVVHWDIYIAKTHFPSLPRYLANYILKLRSLLYRWEKY